MPVVKKAGLFKKLADAIKFKKNARAKEQQRILDIIDKTGLKKTLDSLSTTISKTDASMAALDSLKKAISDLKAAMDKNNQKTPGKKTNPPVDSTIDNPATDIETPMNDSDIEDLAKQIVPLIAAQDDPQVEKAKRTRLRLIRSVLSQTKDVVDTVIKSDSMKHPYQVKVSIPKTVIGVYNFENSKNYRSIDLKLFNTLAWYAASFEGKTGNIDAHGWDSAKVLDLAQQAGCKLTLMLINEREANLRDLIHSASSQKKLSSDIITLLKGRHAESITIYFKDLPASERDSFTNFISRLSVQLRRSEADYKICIVIPCNDTEEAYDLESLNNYADKFYIDFTGAQTSIPGPLAPLQGTAGNDLKTSLGQYLSTGIATTKFIAYLPYYGYIWRPDARRNFVIRGKPISYNDIRSDYPFVPLYDKASSTAFMDIRAKDSAGKKYENNSGPVIGRIWFDDDKTMSLKYDMVVDNGLGGVAIQAMGYDGNYGEMRDALTDKFLIVDTSWYAAVSMTPRKKGPPPEDTWKWDWTYINAKFEQYSFLFAYPCETSFPTVLKRKWAQEGVLNLSRKRIRAEVTDIMRIMTLTLLILCLFFLGFFIYQVRRLAKWQWKKFFAGLLIFLSILLTVSSSMFLFTNTGINGFGASDSPQDCYDFPISTIFSFIFCGILIGGLITRFLVFPLIKREDIP